MAHRSDKIDKILLVTHSLIFVRHQTIFCATPDFFNRYNTYFYIHVFF